MRKVFLAVIACALLAAVSLPGCTAAQVSEDVVTARIALAPLKAQVAAMPDGPVKAKMLKSINKLDKGAADAAGWAIAVSELETYFRTLFDQLKAMNPATHPVTPPS